MAEIKSFFCCTDGKLFIFFLRIQAMNKAIFSTGNKTHPKI